jgi:hypothetical protein
MEAELLLLPPDAGEDPKETFSESRMGSDDNGTEPQIKALEILVNSGDISNLHGEEAVKLIEELDQVCRSVCMLLSDL